MAIRYCGRQYRERLSTIPDVLLQEDTAGSESGNWMNGLVITPDYGHTRDDLITHLRNHGIDTRLFFNGMHRQPALKAFGCHCESDYPVSDMLADNGFYLPSSTLQESDIDRICDVIAAFRR